MMVDEESHELGSDPGTESGIETACYLCYARCVNQGKHGSGVRPCARNLAAIVSREERLRRRSRKTADK